MILQDKEIYFNYQDPALMSIFIEKSREGIHAFNDYLLEQLRKMYQDKTLKSTYILHVSSIKQRSMIQVGEFLNDGKEVVSVTIRAHVTTLAIERGGLIPVKILEINQGSSNDDVKLITAQGVDGLEMIRAHIQIHKQQAATMPLFNTGQIIPLLCENSVPNKGIIDVDGSLYYPRMSSAQFRFNVAKLDPQALEPVMNKIKLARTKLNSFPQKLHAQVLQMLSNESAVDERMVKIEDIDFTKPCQFQMTTFCSFAGFLIPSQSQTVNLEILTEQALIQRLYLLHSQMKTVEAIAQNIQQDPERRFNELQEHMAFSFKLHNKPRDKKKSE